MAQIDKSGSFFIDDDASIYKKLIEKGYILELEEIAESRNGTRYYCSYYEHYTFGNDSSSIERLKEEVKRLKEGTYARVCFVERRYETGSEGESPDRSDWARPKYKVLKTLTPEEFLRETANLNKQSS